MGWSQTPEGHLMRMVNEIGKGVLWVVDLEQVGAECL
jgi:hypothetical protein